MSRQIKLISWNVNGLRAIMAKAFTESLRTLDADVVALQETKLQQPQVTDEMENLDDYRSYWSFCTIKKGYSGVATYTRLEAQAVRSGIGIPAYDDEGRILEMDFGDFVFFNIYFPNGGMGPDRLQYKLDFYRDFFQYADGLRGQGRSLVITGDYNTAHNEIDLKNPKANENTSGFLRVERDWIDEIVARGYVDTFRHFHPETVQYSWWTYRFQARSRNAGWRIDYFFVTRDIIDKGWITEAFIADGVLGSDHCPIGLTLEI